MAILTQAQIAADHRPACPTDPKARIRLPGAGVVIVRAYSAEAFLALAAVMAHYRYSTRAADTGGGVCRLKVSGDGWSNHAYWTATDSNWQSNPYNTRRTDRPRGMTDAICSIRTRNGRQVFNNGIRWRSGPDPMHDEIVCRRADLATGIDWSTVAGHGTAPVPPPPPVQLPAPTPTPGLPSFTPPTGVPMQFFISDPAYGIRLVITDGQCVMDYGVTDYLTQLSKTGTFIGGPMTPAQFDAFCKKYPGGRTAMGHLPK